MVTVICCDIHPYNSIVVSTPICIFYHQPSTTNAYHHSKNGRDIGVICVTVFT